MDTDSPPPRNVPPSESVEDNIRRVCDVLGTIASQYPSDSAESLAIRDAALAYHTVQLSGWMKRSYDKLRDALTSGDGELTDEMKDRLRSFGIDPDEFDEE